VTDRRDTAAAVDRAAAPPPTNAWHDVRRLAGAAAVYAAAGLAQRGLSFVLLPIYTRLIDPVEYGTLEVLNAFGSVVFSILSLGLASAINKCYHRDCTTPGEQATLLSTALVLVLPLLTAGTVALWMVAGPLGEFLVGREAAARMLPLVGVSVALGSVWTVVLASLRAQERASAFVLLSLSQFVAGVLLNVFLVVGCGWGVYGVLWGNVGSHLVSLPVVVGVVRGRNTLAFSRHLARPLLAFGLAVVPLMLSAWVMEVSDRYLLSLFRTLDEVAAYGVGYKLGMLVEVAIVWPFQLAWPAFAFAISRREGHRQTYARTLTYLCATLALVVLVTALVGERLLFFVVGERYRDGLAVLGPVALAYALNGVQYCVAPPVHLAGKTRLMPLLAGAAALVNLLLNLVAIPRFGILGAAWSTTIAFAVLALGTMWLGQRVYPVPYEYGRLLKLTFAAVAVYVVAKTAAPSDLGSTLLWHLVFPIVGLPSLLALLGFLDESESRGLREALSRARAA
jgi:O-antigen/teichoic acid export membrane protein